MTWEPHLSFQTYVCSVYFRIKRVIIKSNVLLINAFLSENFPFVRNHYFICIFMAVLRLGFYGFVVNFSDLLISR